MEIYVKKGLGMNYCLLIQGETWKEVAILRYCRFDLVEMGVANFGT